MTWREGNQLTLLRNGGEYFPALLAAINSARDEIFLESYLYEPDAIGRLVSARLMRAARRGVAVQLLLDGYGAAQLPKALQFSLRSAGVKLLFFRPESSRFALKRQRLRRMHRKLVVVDGTIAFVGGINILDDIDAPGLAPRYDYAVSIRGPLVADCRHIAASQWRQTCWTQLNAAWTKLPRPPRTPNTAGNVPAQLLRRDNLRHRRSIERAYLNAIRDANREIILANAYFLPGLSLRHALLAAAKRGVRVVILLQGRIDQALLHYATRVLYQPLLSAGIEIYEYHAGFMHAKVAVIDGRWATVGSSNIDPFSLLTAREANIEVHYVPIASELQRDIQHHLDNHALRIHADDITKRNWWQRIVPWMAYQLVRGLLGLTGYGGREYRE